MVYRSSFDLSYLVLAMVSAPQGLGSPFGRGRMSLRLTPITTHSLFIQPLNSAGFRPSNFFSPRMILARLVEFSLVALTMPTGLG